MVIGSRVQRAPATTFADECDFRKTTFADQSDFRGGDFGESDFSGGNFRKGNIVRRRWCGGLGLGSAYPREPLPSRVTSEMQLKNQL